MRRIDARRSPSPQALDLHSAADGIYYTRDLREQSVAIFYGAASVLPDPRIDQLAEMRSKPFVGPSSSAPISREYPATSAARFAARRRVCAMAVSTNLGPRGRGSATVAQFADRGMRLSATSAVRTPWDNARGSSDGRLPAGRRQ
jgi:hypothetical protein